MASVRSSEGGALLAKLEAAIRQLDKENAKAGANQLQAFINQVEELVSAGSLSAEEAQALIDAASALLALLGG